MKWLVLAWFFRRDIWEGWKGQELVTPMNVSVGGWIERPLEVPPFTKEAVERFYTKAAGTPILTRNQARARLNLPPVEGGENFIRLPHIPKRWNLLRRCLRRCCRR